MEGQTVSHYRVLEKLGGGGMGVVYKALDTKLNRHVALKFLPPELTRDDDAKERFVREAQSASALDHPNICTIHEIDETRNGQLFITMGYCDGETLKQRIEAGPISVAHALDIALQTAKGLAEAHATNIVHRDIKPANIMLMKSGLVKIVDFGIAKPLGVTGPTQTGTTLGTVHYMSPEQVAGEEVDQQSDVWALGSVLYEMLTTQQPFKGESPWSVMNSISNRSPERPTTLCPEIPTDVERVVLHALQKRREHRFTSATIFANALRECQNGLTQSIATAAPGGNLLYLLVQARVALPLALILLALGSLAIVAISRGADARWAREEAVPQIIQLVNDDDLVQAFELSSQALRYIPNDPILAELLPSFSASFSVTTTPPGADVHVRAYATVDDSWRRLGLSPVSEVRLPRGSYRWRIEHEGFETVELATPSQTAAIDVSLVESGSIPAGMVFVPSGSAPVNLTGFSLQSVSLDGFLIDAYEVTNQQFKEFVDAGGYDSPEHWEGQRFVHEGRELSWAEAMALLVDTTGRPGPATWELGDFPSGHDSYPVGGVSWHEAAAYAHFRDKSLPTLYHWSRAALSAGEIINPLGPDIVPLSNFEGTGAAPVGQHQGVGPYGTYDMAGNVREWVWNAVGEGRGNLGGAWSDPEYMYSLANDLPAFDRSPLNGFRCVRYPEGNELPEDLAAQIQRPRSTPRDAEPVSADVFDVYRSQFAYASSSLNARAEPTDVGSDDWTRERLTLDAAYGDEEVVAYLFLPKAAQPPYQTIIYFPGIGAFNSRRSSESLNIGGGVTSRLVLDAIVKTGRVVVWPVYQGSYERFTTRYSALGGQERMIFIKSQVIQWYQDLARTLDYLEGRDDIDIERIGYLGASYGASAALPLLALEQRLKVAVLLSGGMRYDPAPPEVDPVHYLPRIAIPVVLLTGSYDYIFPVESHQVPLFERLGTPAQLKRHVRYEAGHSPLPRGPVIRETIDWLDTYLGEVE